MDELTYDELRSRVKKYPSRGRHSEVDKATKKVVLLALDWSAERLGIGTVHLIIAAKELVTAAENNPAFAGFLN